MTKLSIAELAEKYRFLSWDTRYVGTPVGWNGIIDRALSDLNDISFLARSSIKILQIKEKYGGLRLYVGYEDELHEAEDVSSSVRHLADSIIGSAESRSFRTCMNCGKVGKQSTEPYRYEVLCAECS